MKCSHCGHDLMVGLVPKGLGKILPMTTYTCVRCGHINRRLSESLTQRGPKLLLAALLLVVLGIGAWVGIIAPGMQQGNTIRREIVATVEQPVTPTQNDTTLDQPKAPTQTKTQDTPAATSGQEAATQPQPKTNEEPLTAKAPVAEIPAVPTPAPADSPIPKTQDKPALSIPAPTTEQAAVATPVTPMPAASDLEEVEVVAPPKTTRPALVTKGKKKKRSTWNATLTGVRSGIWKDALILNLNVKGLAGDPTGFQLSSPSRYVVDVPGTWTYAGDKKISVNKGSATAIRFGVYPDKLRIVLDLESDPKQASVRRTPNGLTITIR